MYRSDRIGPIPVQPAVDARRTRPIALVATAVSGRRYATALSDRHAVQDADRFAFMRARRAAAARDAKSAGTAAPVPKI